MHFFGHQNTFFFSCLNMGGSDIPGIQCDFITLQKKRERELQTPALRKTRKPSHAQPQLVTLFLLKMKSVTSIMDAKAPSLAELQNK